MMRFIENLVVGGVLGTAVGVFLAIGWVAVMALIEMVKR